MPEFVEEGVEPVVVAQRRQIRRLDARVGVVAARPLVAGYCVLDDARSEAQRGIEGRDFGDNELGGPV